MACFTRDSLAWVEFASSAFFLPSLLLETRMPEASQAWPRWPRAPQVPKTARGLRTWEFGLAAFCTGPSSPGMQSVMLERKLSKL